MYDFTLHLRIHEHTTWFWIYVGTAFGDFFCALQFHGHGSWLMCKVAPKSTLHFIFQCEKFISYKILHAQISLHTSSWKTHLNKIIWHESMHLWWWLWPYGWLVSFFIGLQHLSWHLDGSRIVVVYNKRSFSSDNVLVKFLRPSLSTEDCECSLQYMVGEFLSVYYVWRNPSLLNMKWCISRKKKISVKKIYKQHFKNS